MFKFTRYFFVVFLITTVIPLVLMFVWNKHQIEKVVAEKEQHFTKIVLSQLQITSKQYLKLREAALIDQLQNISNSTASLNELRDSLGVTDVQLLNRSRVSNSKSYYEVNKNKSSGQLELDAVLIIPFSLHNKTGIKVVEQVNASQLHPPGPFIMEIYAGKKTDKSSLIASIGDPFFNSNHEFPPGPPHHRPNNFMPGPPFPNERDHFRFRPPPMENNGFMHIPPAARNLKIITTNNTNNKINLTDNNGKIVASIVIKHIRHAKPFDMKDPIENGFGLIILLAGASLSVLIGYYINKNFINPMLILSNASKKIQKGDLSFELQTPTKDAQILNTFSNFNEMIKGLKEKDELRKNFITNLTHDLRTPLIAQERSLELIAGEFEALGIKDAHALAKGIQKNNQHLLRMVNLILESYRFDSEELKLHISNINILELINECFDNLTPLSSEKNIQLINNISEKLPPINGDLTCFKRIFVNLISNSIENINPDGKVEISAVEENNHIKIFVTDDGPGIADADIKHIFERYYTGKSDERKIGSGLGLYVCKKLISMHKGQISVESKKGSYTKFVITIPMSV